MNEDQEQIKDFLQDFFVSIGRLAFLLRVAEGRLYIRIEKMAEGRYEWRRAAVLDLDDLPFVGKDEVFPRLGIVGGTDVEERKENSEEKMTLDGFLALIFEAIATAKKK